MLATPFQGCVDATSLLGMLRIQELAEERARTKAAENVRAFEHSMALADQAVGGIERKIDEETSRLLKRSGKK